MEGQVERRETTGGVLGVSFGLLLAFGLILALVFARGGAVDGAERARELFGDQPPPFGLMVTRAARLPTGETVLSLVAPDGRAGGPAEVAFLEYPSAAAVEALFGERGRGRGRGGDDEHGEGPGRKLIEWEEDPSFAWHTTLEQDEITWGEWRSKYARLRHFHEGGGWHETARVDLNQPGRHLALFVTWDDGEVVKREELVRLLNAVQMLPVDE